MIYIVIALAFIFFAFLLGRSATENKARLEAALKTIGLHDPKQMASDQQLVQLANMGYKIAAIKLYRIQRGGGLKASKEAIERLQRGQSAVDPSAPSSQSRGQNFGQNTSQTKSKGLSINIDLFPNRAAVLSPDQIDELAALWYEGRRVEAIKVYREYTGQDLAEAKSNLEAMFPETQE